ncbi:MAG TPA: hypothetical protein VGQ91_09205 [Ideonella sp.]|nr:hypothetical protein [Ideonella sp.]
MDSPADKQPPVLVVNSSIGEAEALCELFDALGAKATLALGAIAAAKLIRTHHPALVFLAEAQLEGDDSHSVLAWLRSQEEDAATRPFYVCIGQGVEQRPRKAPIEFDLYVDAPMSSAFAGELMHVAQRKHEQVARQRRYASSGGPPAGELRPGSQEASPPAARK